MVGVGGRGVDRKPCPEPKEAAKPLFSSWPVSGWPPIPQPFSEAVVGMPQQAVSEVGPWGSLSLLLLPSWSSA